VDYSTQDYGERPRDVRETMDEEYKEKAEGSSFTSLAKDVCKSSTRLRHIEGETLDQLMKSILISTSHGDY
jgi:hypothetical protein